MVIHFKSASYPVEQGEESSRVNYRSQRGGSFSNKRSALARSFSNFALRYQTLIKIKVKEGNVTGVKRQLVSLRYHSVNQSDENVDIKLIIMYSMADIAFMKDETQDE